MLTFKRPRTEFGQDALLQLNVARTTAASERAAKWSRDPLDLHFMGRIACELAESAPAATQLLEALGGQQYHCERHTPLAPALLPGETFEGTLQVCCFRRLAGLSDAALHEAWLGTHTKVALSTQCTVGYHQNWVATSDVTHFDGIVEEYFPPEASERVDWFFDAVDDPLRLQQNIQVMTQSTANFLALDSALVKHVTDSRLV